MIRIIVQRDRGPINAGGREMWNAWTEDGRPLVHRSRQPFFDSARILIDHGADPGELCTMRHDGVDHDSFEPMRLAAAAKLAVTEGDRSARIMTWRSRAEIVGSDARSTILGPSSASDVSPPTTAPEADE